MNTSAQRLATISFRVVFGLALIAVFIRMLAKQNDLPIFNLGADEVEHSMYIYGLTLLACGAAPNASPLLIGGAFIALGGVVEGLQGAGLLPGMLELRDWLADIAGVLTAVAPVVVGRATRPAKVGD